MVDLDTDTSHEPRLAELLRPVVTHADLAHEPLLVAVCDAVDHRPLLQRRVLGGGPVQLADGDLLHAQPPQRAPAAARWRY
jgi:hypothetical protein